ncbi:hypothetical protein OIU84_008466 [Salix udensis]|uniref:Uncharacterized protein n=1 Tax=Salix udensis TaxID=889485 RepID=A0AAD6JPF6_9ROSI|nr:hypothetical protein OIU84_008466 [Salix udensis]
MTVIPSFVHQSLKGDADSADSLSSSWSWIFEPVVLLSKIMSLYLKMDLKLFFMWSLLATPFMLYVNGKLAGSGTGNAGNAKVAVEIPVTLLPGKNTIDLLSLTAGLPNYGAFFDLKGAGITGPVKLKGLENGTTVDLSALQWTYQIGLKGEELGLSSGNSQWVTQPALPTKQPLIWYKGSV